MTEFREISYAKAVNTIAARVLELEGKKAFPPTSDFFRLRSFFSKQDRLKINILFDYLCTLERSNDSLSELFRKAEQYQHDQAKFSAAEAKAITLKDVLDL